MALEYVLYLDTPLPAEMVRRAVLAAPDVTPAPPQWWCDAVAPGVQIVVNAVARCGGWHHSRLPRDWTTLVLFRLDKNIAGRPDPPDGWLASLHVVQHVLRSVPGDALYLFAVGVVELLRDGGDLVVNSDGVWTPHRLTALALPYRLEPIAVE